MKYKIIDDVLPDTEFHQIKIPILSSSCGWHFNNSISSKKDSNYFYFTHLFYNHSEPNSPFYQSLSPLLRILKARALIKIKGNLYTRTEKKETHPSHIDFDFEHKGAIFYINTNNGLTILEDDTEIKSIANRLLLFDSTKPHRSTSCTDEKYRMNININYF